MGAAAGTHHQAPASGAPQAHIRGCWKKVNQLKANVDDVRASEESLENSEEFEIVFEVI
jgi:hypothetical protein